MHTALFEEKKLLAGRRGILKKLRRGDFPEFFPKAGVGPVLNVSLMKWEHPPRAEHPGEGAGGGVGDRRSLRRARLCATGYPGHSHSPLLPSSCPNDHA